MIIAYLYDPLKKYDNLPFIYHFILFYFNINKNGLYDVLNDVLDEMSQILCYNNA